MKYKFFAVIGVLLFAMAQTQAQQYDTLPYNIGVPQFYMQNSLDSMHFAMNEEGEYVMYPIIRLMYKLTNTSIYNDIPIPTDHPVGDNHDYAMGFYVDTTMKVVGIAWCDISPYWVLPGSVDSTEVRLYVPEGNNMLPLVSKTVGSDTMVNSRVYAPLMGWTPQENLFYESLIGAATTVARYLYVFEIYFDREYDVTDSFYVSIGH